MGRKTMMNGDDHCLFGKGKMDDHVMIVMVLVFLKAFYDGLIRWIHL